MTSPARAACVAVLLLATALAVVPAAAQDVDAFSFAGRNWSTYERDGVWYMASGDLSFEVRPGFVSAAFDTTMTEAQIESAVSRIPGLSILWSTPFNVATFSFSPEESPGYYAAALSRLGGAIASCPHPLAVVDSQPDDPHFWRQWGLHNEGADSLCCDCVEDADVDAPEAWEAETGDTTVIIAIIDSGASLAHEDLWASLWTNWTEAAGSDSTDDDGNGKVDDIHGYDFWENDGDPSHGAGEYLWHGSHVAGIAAAKTNNDVTGIAGIAGGWGGDRSTGCRLMIVRNGLSGGGDMGVVPAAIAYAVGNGADVINMSFHTEAPEVLGLEAAVNYAWSQGVLLVATSGNDEDDPVYLPAKLPKVMTVSATTCADARASYSTKGPEVNLAAPGGDTWSVPELRNRIYSTTTDSPYSMYHYKHGTSMAAPLVAGAAALARSAYPGVTNSEMWALLESSSDDTVGTASRGWDERYGWGRLNAKTMMDALDYRPNSYFTYPEASCQVFCPGGDADTFVISVTIRDGNDDPVEGVPASVIWGETTSTTFKVCCADENVPDCIINYERVYADAPTDSLGATTITFTAGGGRSGSKSVVYSVPLTQVRVYGLQIEGYGELSLYPFRSFDITKDCVVDAADVAAFHTARVRHSKTAADFDCDNDVDTADSLLLAAHVGHQCSPSRGGRDITEPSPAADVLRQNAPNPFNPATTITYQVQSDQTPVRVMVYSVAGRLVRTLVDDLETAGSHEVIWDGRDDNGRELASGVYFYRIETPGSREQRKMVLLR